MRVSQCKYDDTICGYVVTLEFLAVVVIFTQCRSIAKSVGYFPHRLLVFAFVFCVFVCQHDNF